MKTGLNEIRSKIKDAMDVLQAFEPACGSDGPTMEELAACWEKGQPYDDDAVYDAMQHCWLLLHEALIMPEKNKGDL